MRMPTTPIGELMTEHRLIQRVIGDMVEIVHRIDSGARVDSRQIDVIVDFLRTYADKCHHGKEEDILFARLAEKDLRPEHDAMMQDLIEGHRYARKKTGILATANEGYAGGDDRALSAMRDALQSLVDFYPEHIEDEDHGFFKPAMEYFSAEEKVDLEDAFEQFDRAMIHETYRHTVEELEASYA